MASRRGRKPSKSRTDNTTMPPDDPSGPPTSTPLAPPAALKAWQEKEEHWRKEAYTWARGKLLEHFQSDRGLHPVTAADLLHLLDSSPDMPTGWAMTLKSDTVSYRARYSIVRNTLEVLARQRHLQMGTTVNTKGQEKVTTYARPRDANAEWSVQIEGTPQAIKRAQDGIRDWLSLDGSVLDGVSELRFVRTAEFQGGSTHNYGNHESTLKQLVTKRQPRTVRPSRNPPMRRKPRSTTGTDE